MSEFDLDSNSLSNLDWILFSIRLGVGFGPVSSRIQFGPRSLGIRFGPRSLRFRFGLRVQSTSTGSRNVD